jgi:hypothetical protein
MNLSYYDERIEPKRIWEIQRWRYDVVVLRAWTARLDPDGSGGAMVSEGEAEVISRRDRIERWSPKI